MQVKVKITETFERVVCIEADSNTDAVVKATYEYWDGKGAIGENGLVDFKIELYEDK